MEILDYRTLAFYLLRHLFCAIQMIVLTALYEKMQHCFEMPGVVVDVHHQLAEVLGPLFFDFEMPSLKHQNPL
jgi:hypothetical protein